MAVTELSPALVAPYDPRRRAAERRAPRDPAPRPEPQIPVALAEPDPALLIPLFRPDLSQLHVGPDRAPPPPAAEVDDALGRLVSAVRQGDVGRARAAFEALETEMLVESSAASAAASPVAMARERLDAASARLAAVAPSAHAADDIYETLAHYLDGDPSL